MNAALQVGLIFPGDIRAGKNWGKDGDDKTKV
jgi:hypothetical protein